ncbi:MAG: DUF3604 domain-containing protein [Deltaproteobacteria bacterium]|nr:DUF3604 domain-containing protein [Deltaproteobacteria bacterium]
MFALAPMLPLLALLAGPAYSAEADFVRTEEREACTQNDPLRRPYFGDTHVHTGYSQDASTQGTRTTPREAYAFAQGAPLAIQPWDADGVPQRTLQLDRPLDFAVVTDHAEQIGEVQLCKTPEAPGHGSIVCRIYRSFPRVAFYLMNYQYSAGGERWGFCGEDDVHCLAAAGTVWKDIQGAAEGAYDRTKACTFTSFVGYEWTSSAMDVQCRYRQEPSSQRDLPQRAGPGAAHQRDGNREHRGRSLGSAREPMRPGHAGLRGLDHPP